MLKIRQSIFRLKTTNQALRYASINAVAGNDEKTAQLKSWREIPGPPSPPIIGKLLRLLPGGLPEEDDGGIGTLYENFGPIVKMDGLLDTPTFIFLFDAEAIAYVLRSENMYPIRPGFNSLVNFRMRNKLKDKPDQPTGLITDQGDVWKQFRSTVNPIMLQPKTIRLYSSILNEVADDMVARMRSLLNEKNVLDTQFDMEMNLWALESIGVVALGGRLNCFDPNLPENSPVRRLIQVVHDIFDNVTKLDFRPNLAKYFPTPLFRKAMKTYEEQLNLSKYFLRKAIEELNTKGESNEEKGVLEKLLGIDEKVAVIMASDMLFAGIDTASNTITATLFLLATNPEKQNKLREEILRNEEKIPYLKACVKESMRMMPVASSNLRQTTKEHNILGYKIPKDTQVIFCHQCLSMWEKHFPRPTEYIPERWLVDKSDPLYYGNAHPFAYSPFGFGVRSCIGRRIAELEIEIFLAKLIKNFEVEWFGEPMRMQQRTLNYAKGPFNFIFKDV